MSLLNKYRSHTTEVESRVQTARAKIHNIRTWIPELEANHHRWVNEWNEVHGVDGEFCQVQNDLIEELQEIRRVLGEAEAALEEL